MHSRYQNQFFISYRWNTYSDEAKELRTLIYERGYSCWLDAEHPFFVDRRSSLSAEEQLGAHLRAAMQACEYVIFFETNMELLLQIGGAPVRHLNWQERELSIAEKERIVVLYHSAFPSVLGFGEQVGTIGYIGLADAFTKITTALYGHGISTG